MPRRPGRAPWLPRSKAPSAARLRMSARASGRRALMGSVAISQRGTSTMSKRVPWRRKPIASSCPGLGRVEVGRDLRAVPERPGRADHRRDRRGRARPCAEGARRPGGASTRAARDSPGSGTGSPRTCRRGGRRAGSGAARGEHLDQVRLRVVRVVAEHPRADALPGQREGDHDHPLRFLALGERHPPEPRPEVGQGGDRELDLPVIGERLLVECFLFGHGRKQQVKWGDARRDNHQPAEPAAEAARAAARPAAARRGEGVPRGGLPRGPPRAGEEGGAGGALFLPGLVPRGERARPPRAGGGRRGQAVRALQGRVRQGRLPRAPGRHPRASRPSGAKSLADLSLPAAIPSSSSSRRSRSPATWARSCGARTRRAATP